VSPSKKEVTEVAIGNRKLELSRLNKVFYPETGFTKGDVISYYRDVASVVIPHLKERPLTLKRYPDGVDGNFFYEKRCPPYAPDWIKTVTITRRRDNKDIDYCRIDNQASLIWAANLANLELHTTLARAKSIGTPTSLVFDLDPGAPADVVDCAEVALELRDLFSDLGLESWCKTSGSKGLQLYVPLNTKTTFAHTREFAHMVAQEFEKKDPDRVVSQMKKELRGGKVFIDWSQNSDFKTTVTAYSLRARPRPTASTPLTWDEIEGGVKKRDAARLTFEAKEVLKRVDKFGDLFEPVLKKRQRLPD
jgi:bifunctional non-homologous end joining protein LigD